MGKSKYQNSEIRKKYTVAMGNSYSSSVESVVMHGKNGKDVVVGPVVFEKSPDMGPVEAYCSKPAIPDNPHYSPKAKQPESPKFDPVPSPALQRMFYRSYQKNEQQRKEKIMHIVAH